MDIYLCPYDYLVLFCSLEVASNGAGVLIVMSLLILNTAATFVWVVVMFGDKIIKHLENRR